MLAVLDWELSTLGHPLADFAYQVMAWRLGPQQFRGLKGFDLPSLGIPSEDLYVDRYLARRGGIAWPDPHAWGFYMAYNMFRLAAILQGDGAGRRGQCGQRCRAGQRPPCSAARRARLGGSGADALSAPVPCHNRPR